ncbi:MAG: MFS transporter [Candidatus Promineifilaceae bacterium]|nr:MFS transporter [Candidatus Promineifilaceae bacterium]
MFKRIKDTYQEFPIDFRVLVLANFVDRLGGTMLFPFFSLYVTQKFGVGMTEAGILIALFSVSGFVGSLFGGALADRFGRKLLIIFGLVASATSSLFMGLVNELIYFYLLAIVAGLLSQIAFPASQAMVADLLPEEQRAEGFGIMRVVTNLAWIIGPTVGGLVATQSYLTLFILDAVSSLITALIVIKYIPETKPEVAHEQEERSFLSTLTGYRIVFKDGLYVLFILVSMLMLIPYQQIYSTLSVYLHDVHGVSAQGYGFLMTLNATFVVILQFWVTRRIKPFAPMLMMAAGTLLYLIGLTLFGFVTAFIFFMIAMVIITFGEMTTLPVSQTLAANFSPLDMRGRYLAIFSLSWTVASAVGPWGAGIIMDNYDPNWVWYLSGIISAVAVVGFLFLNRATKERFAAVDDPIAADQEIQQA